MFLLRGTINIRQGKAERKEVAVIDSDCDL